MITKTIKAIQRMLRGLVRRRTGVNAPTQAKPKYLRWKALSHRVKRAMTALTPFRFKFPTPNLPPPSVPVVVEVSSHTFTHGSRTLQQRKTSFPPANGGVLLPSSPTSSPVFLEEPLSAAQAPASPETSPLPVDPVQLSPMTLNDPVAHLPQMSSHLSVPSPLFTASYPEICSTTRAPSLGRQVPPSLFGVGEIQCPLSAIVTPASSEQPLSQTLLRAPKLRIIELPSIIDSDINHQVLPNHQHVPLFFSSNPLGLTIPPSLSAFPDELILLILQHLLSSSLSSSISTTPTHLLLHDVRHVSRRWRRLAESLIRPYLIITPDFFANANADLVAWYRRLQVGDEQQSRPVLDTIDFTVPAEPDRGSGGLDIFSQGLLRCRKAAVRVDPVLDVGIHVPYDNPDLREFSWESRVLGIRHHLAHVRLPFVKLRTEIPWWQLTVLNLNCPLSLKDCWEVMEAGRNTLREVSLLMVGYPLLSDVPDEEDSSISSPSIDDNDNEIVPLSRLISFAIQSHISIQPLLRRFTFPLLSSIHLRALPDHPLHDANVVEPMKISAELALPWSHLVELKLANESFRETVPVGRLLTKCEMLEKFSWGGSGGEFEVPDGRLDRRYTPRLKALDINCGEQEGEALLQLLESTSFRPSLETISLPKHSLLTSHFRLLFDRVTSIAIHQPMPLSQLISLLRLYQDTLISGDFTIGPGTISVLSALEIRLTRLSRLQLTSSTCLSKLWAILQADVIQNISLIYGQPLSFSVDDLQPLLASSGKTISSLDCNKDVGILPGYDRYDLTII
ncbi:hypothetical protein CVT26_008614 [Gymnopilus dilepis]|uniref:F-box domain-containing protein n=1 Tax=Gymnopilus dilepis TaxID=231916 RepID=A0A409XXU1_9AGAR|nr:hypothetical protein CVT26_008614 [Gymnopilus dilepis]